MVIPYKSVATIVLAGGSGERFGTRLKQFFRVNGKSVLFHTVDLLLDFHVSKVVLVVVPSKKVSFVRRQYSSSPQVVVIAGGNSRYESTKIGLTYLAGKGEYKIKYVYIHDGVRPFITRKNFVDLYRSLVLGKCHGSVLYLPVTDSLVEFYGKFNDNKYLERNKIISLQTPHMYKFDILWKCFSQYSGKDLENAQLIEMNHKRLAYVLGSRENIKLTYIQDVSVLKKMISL